MSILLAGGLPGEPDPINRVHWTEDAGLRFESPSQVVSESSLWLESDSFTLEVWLSPDEPLGVGHREILSFVDGSRVRPLLLAQWTKGFLLRSRVDNPEGRPDRDRYGKHPAASPVHLAVVGQGDRATLFVDGESTHVAVAMPERPLGGRLLLGSSDTGWEPWRGEIQAVAIYDRAIGPAELSRHAASSPLVDPVAATSESGLVAFYLFDALKGSRVDAREGFRFDALKGFRFGAREGLRIPSRRAGAPALLLPERVRWPNQPGLEFSFPASKNWFRRDLVINMLGFVPLGLLVAWRRGRSGLLVALGSGFVLSLGVELAQVFIPGRHSSASDWISNTLGAGIGAGLALVAQLRARSSTEPRA